jgi:hypothetical protein
LKTKKWKHLTQSWQRCRSIRREAIQVFCDGGNDSIEHICIGNCTKKSRWVLLHHYHSNLIVITAFNSSKSYHRVMIMIARAKIRQSRSYSWSCKAKSYHFRENRTGLLIILILIIVFVKKKKRLQILVE